MATTITVPNENIGFKSRFTKDGRQLTYKLSVIQQPERARACGQGAKASSDRRPVDPPPIVELHIYEGQEGQQQDITFNHNANFFLFATLENARTIAQGRVSAAQQATSQPVLTGTPVAGISYLDRPTPAGYFIFPDLSVRHEGKYRLSFTLFEEMKHEKDIGADVTEAALSQDKGVSAHVHGRCEVKSTPFTVYSAKKFPGLAESTALSRTVADQGCRVRIRRDVRMRRREGKPGKDWDDYEDETAADRAHATPTPDATPRSQHPSSAIEPMERPPSASNVSSTSYHLPPSRRTSVHDMQAPFQAPAQPMPQQQQQQQQQQHFPQSEPSVPPPPPYPSHLQGYEHSYPTGQPQHFIPQGPPGPPGPPQYSQTAYPYQQQVPQYAFAQPQTAMYDHSHGMTYAPQPPAPTFQPSQYQPQSSPIAPQNFQPQHPTPSNSASQLPPLKAFDESRPKMEPTSPLGMNEMPRPSPFDFGPHPAPPPQYVTANTGPAPKRAYGAVFSTQHINQPLRSGARPDGLITQSPHDSSEYSDEDIDMESFKMTYRRANGETIARDWPQYS